MCVARSELVVCLLIIAATVSVFWPIRSHEFITYDDPLYVVHNNHVRTGLSGNGVVWAFTTTHASNWHPLTWLSHMLDCHIYGLNAGSHHLTNLLFHVGNSVLLFLVLGRMTGMLWQSAIVAALFALHPLHVESVAWVSQRKDLLSTFFWILSMVAYLWYVRKQTLRRYFLLILSFALGLMAKPMLVTLPFVFLLLDFWPLGRFSVGASEGRYPVTMKRKVVYEKWPLLALAAASSTVTYLVQAHGPAVQSLSLVPLKSRISNALVSYATYIGKMIWPSHLAVYYPYPVDGLPMWKVAGSVVLLVSISIFVFWQLQKRPYLLAGWLWYLGTLVPVIGLVQVGTQAMADRYTYVPFIGLFIVLVWGGAELVPRRRYRGYVFILGTGLLLLVLAICTRLQLHHWRNSVMLFQHATSSTVNNHIAYNHLGVALLAKGKIEEGIIQFSEAVRIKSDYAEAHYNLGAAMTEHGQTEEAIRHFSQALRIKPNDANTHYGLGIVMERQGKIQEAIRHYSDASQINPGHAEAHYNLGVLMEREGILNEAAVHYSKAIRIKPDWAEAHNNLGVVLARQGKFKTAIDHFSRALSIRPDFKRARNNLKLALRKLDQSASAPSNAGGH